MIEVLPIKLLREEDAQIYGSLNVALGKLSRLGLPVASGIVITPPNLKLKTTLEQFDFGTKEVFEQSLTLVKKEIEKTEIPDILEKEVGNHKKFWTGEKQVSGLKSLWITLLNLWIEQIKQRLWANGFYPGITEGLEPLVVIFINKQEAYGSSWYDPILDDVVISIKSGKFNPPELKKVDELTNLANKKLFMPYTYEWILDRGIKIIGISPYTPTLQSTPGVVNSTSESAYSFVESKDGKRTTVKVYFNLSVGFTVEKEVDGIYIESEKIFDLNRPESSWEELVFKLVEAAQTYPDVPVLCKLADMSEGLPAGRQGMGKLRGALRLLHQKNLLDPLCEAILFARNKKEHKNVHLVIPFARGVNELMQVRRELSTKNLTRKNSLQIWMEIAVPENITNLEEYLVTGLDGVILNLDELASHFSGFDHNQDDLTFYKAEVAGLIKFLEDGLKLLHKSKVPFIGYGKLSLNPSILEFLVEKGVYGIVVERYEVPSIHELLHDVEKRMILRRAS